MNRIRRLIFGAALWGMFGALQAAPTIEGLHAPVRVVRDSQGIPHIFATNPLDAYFMQGWVHAEDRLFQMDLARRQVGGRLAELVGASALEADVAARTLGLDRAAMRSLSSHPEAMTVLLQAYADGVNAFIDRAEASDDLPPEYGLLGLTQVRRWTPLDSEMVAKGLAATTSLLVADEIELTLAQAAYAVTGQALGFDGAALFSEDLFRSAPFDPASTVIDAEYGWVGAHDRYRHDHGLSPSLARQAGDYLRRLREIHRHRGTDMSGSNTWVVAGRHTENGRPLLANDMHLPLANPALFHQVHLAAPGLDVVGSSIAGAPCVVQGKNRDIAWGVTNSRLDVTDVYAETIVPDPSSPSGLSSLFEGAREPIVPVPLTFFFNPLDGGPLVQATEGVPPAALILPRRNQGPLITAPRPDPRTGALSALSVQSVAFSGTRDLEGFCELNRARDLNEFERALRLIDFASQNISYADNQGNVAYFVTGEVPLREDLQAAVPGDPVSPPFLIREGTGGHEWMPADARPDDQALAYAIIPFEEMPQTINPPSGLIVNANNDQAGNTLDNNPLNDLRPTGGLYYLNWGGRNFSIRAGRITRMLHDRLSAGERLTDRDMEEMQADTVLGDARILLPYLLTAYERAAGPDAPPRLSVLAGLAPIREAIERFREWDLTTPTGIAEGYDAGPGDAAVEASIAASIYSTWRGVMVSNTIDAVLESIELPPVLEALGLAALPRPSRREEAVTALRHLLERDGLGASGVDFFAMTGVGDAATRRDVVVLESLRDALDLLASDAFAPAFANSRAQQDYRWGKLHRLVLKHPLGAVAPGLNVPPALGLVPPILPGLDGIPVDGGFETVDEAPPVIDVRVADSDSFMFGFGPAGRFVARFARRGIHARSSLPGGESAVPSSDFYLNLLEPWLLNESYALRTSRGAVAVDAYDSMLFTP